MKKLYLSLIAMVACCTTMLFISCENNTPSAETPDENTETPDYGFDNYIAFNGEATELKSMCYIVNDTGDMGIQYAMAMTNAEGVTRFDDIIEEDEYLFLSLDQQTLMSAINDNEGKVDVMTIAPENVVYMFVAKMGEMDFMDNTYNRLHITKGELTLNMGQEEVISVSAYFETVNNDKIELAATLPYYEEEPIVTDTFFRYTWGDISVDSHVGSAYAEERAEGVIYTICKDAIKTYVYYEDTPFLKVEVAGKTLNNDFKIDVATYEGEFSIWACDPIKGMDLRVSNDNRTNRTGVIEVKGGVLSCTNLCYNDVTVNINFNETYRSVNECVEIVYDERNELFTPRSVILYNNPAEDSYQIYVSREANITTLQGMRNPDLVVTYPNEGWEKWLIKGNFVSGSSYPDMSIKLGRATYVKGEGECIGMNCQIPAYDPSWICLNINLYTEKGGAALYYSGTFTLIEE